MTPELLEAATGCSSLVAQVVTPFLTAAMTKHSILDNPRRAAHFLAQCAYESALFTLVEENLNYSARGLCATWPKRFYLAPDEPNGRLDANAYAHNSSAIANVVYADRMGNGSQQSGDGFKFRGRGFIQITGRNNYIAFNTAEPTMPCITYPDVLTTAEGAALSAAWFWRRAGCNDAADADLVSAVTQKINGGLLGIEDRTVLTTRARHALGA